MRNKKNLINNYQQRYVNNISLWPDYESSNIRGKIYISKIC